MLFGQADSSIFDARAAASSTPPKPKTAVKGKATGKKAGVKVKGTVKRKDDDDFSGASSGSDDDSAPALST